MTESLSKILQNKFLKKGDNGKNPAPNKVKDVNKGNNTEVTVNTMTKDKLNVSDVAPVTTVSKANKLKFKKVCEGIIRRLEQRRELLSIAGNDDQRTIARVRLTEAHGMMSRFAKEYEERRLKFKTPNNVTNPEQNRDEDGNAQSNDDDSYENRFKDFENRVNSQQSSSQDFGGEDGQDFGGEDGQDFGGEDGQDDSFTASGVSSGYSDVSGEITIGDIINKVIDAIRQDPDLSVVDAVKQSIGEQNMSEDDFDYDDDQDDVDTDFSTSQSQSMNQSATDTNPTQQAQRSDGSLMGFKRLQ